jgi:hypothetical protein
MTTLLLAQAQVASASADSSAGSAAFGGVMFFLMLGVIVFGIILMIVWTLFPFIVWGKFDAVLKSLTKIQETLAKR